MSTKVALRDGGDLVCCNMECTFGTGTTRFLQVAGIVLLPLIPALILVVVSSVLLSGTVKEYHQASQTKQSLDQLAVVGDVLEAIYKEMEGIATLLETGGVPILGKKMDFYEQTDQVLGQIEPWPSSEVGASLYEHRSNSDNATLINEIDFYTVLARDVIDWATDLLRENIPSSTWTMVPRFHAYVTAMEDFAIAKTLGSVFFFAGPLKVDGYRSFVSAMGMGEDNVDFSVVFGMNVNQDITDSIEEIVDLQQMVLKKKANDNALVNGFIWNRVLSRHQEIMLRDLLGQLNKDKNSMSMIVESSLTTIVFRVVVIFTILLGFIPFLVISAKRSDHTLHAYTLTMEINSKALFREKRRTERLIRDMLPSTIAYKMMKNTTVEAEYFESVTVFFSDIVDFADISMASTPYDVVAFLNGIYNLIDSRLQWFDVYKVETIGCVYMVVSGLPLQNGSRHASEIAKMALDIMEETENLGVLHMPNRKILIRAGAHTGPVVGGVVGNKMPRYCLFGDTVNTASRMQSNGEGITWRIQLYAMWLIKRVSARRIHISEATMRMLQSDKRFTMSERGEMFIKGKGMMTTYWVDSMVASTTNSRIAGLHQQDPSQGYGDTLRQKGSHAS